MTIERTRVVDAIADDIDEGIATLLLTDHLEWDASQPDHLLLLQEKLNTYIAFFESGEIFESRPHLRNRKIAVKIVGLYPLSANAAEFVARAKEALAKINLGLTFELNEHALD